MTYKEQYKKLRKNIQKQIKYYKDKGFLVENEIPDIPKRVTKASVRKLEKYKSSFKKLNFIDVETGEKGKLDKLKRERKKEYKRQKKISGQVMKKQSIKTPDKNHPMII